ncbi:hypothetical protein ACNOYE_19500 [Nannocystaceae bacterium ST9]
MSGFSFPLALALVVGIVGLLAFTAWSLLRLFRKGAREAEQRLLDKLGRPDVLLRDAAANGLGLRSLGPVQLRGNGVLLLTRDVLAFQPWFRSEPIVIERATITSAATKRSHLGKSIGRDLLAVEFAGDEYAWYVRALPPWLDALTRR